MLFYDSPNPAPNPRRVRIFLAEKQVRVPTAPVSITAGEHKGADYLAINPYGQTPSLALDNGAPRASRSAAISRGCIRSRRCSARARSTARRSICGRGASSSG